MCDCVIGLVRIKNADTTTTAKAVENFNNEFPVSRRSCRFLVETEGTVDVDV